MDESPLPGGFVNAVVRVGETVRRPVSPRSGFVAELLQLLETAGWGGAPRHLGRDDQGREILDYLPGHVAWEPHQPPAVSSDESLRHVARLVREFHDVAAGSALAAGQETVCHNDLSPKNTVYRPIGGALRPVALIDWDLAAPGRRIHDVAHVCWQYIGLGPALTDPDAAGSRIRLIADAYGLADRRDLVSTVLWWQDRCWRGIEAAAEAGDPAMARLRDTGAAREVRNAHRWVTAHRPALERAVA